MDQSDPDFPESFDDADRIDRRIAHGVYRITHNKRDIGQELWGIFGLKEGGYRVMSEIDLRWPVENQQRTRFDLGADWQPRVLWVQIDAEDTRRFATYAPDDSDAIEVAIYEQPLRHADRDSGAGKKTTVSMTPIGKQKQQLSAATHGLAQPRQILVTQLARTPTTLLDFGSTLFNFAHLRLLRLAMGHSASVTTVIPSQPTLAPMTVNQTYTFTRTEQIANALDGFNTARRYVITEDGDNAPITTLWTDDRDIAIRQEIMMGNELHGCDLVSYTWLG
jgi:hypothetical protein